MGGQKKCPPPHEYTGIGIYNVKREKRMHK